MAHAVLDHHNGIGTIGQGRSSHDLDGLSGSNKTGERFAGADFADRLEAAWKIRGARGESIAHGAIEWGIVSIGEYVLGQNTTDRCAEVDSFGGRRRSSHANFAQHHGASVFKCQGGGHDSV
jgi:hypothetical protein